MRLLLLVFLLACATDAVEDAAADADAGALDAFDAALSDASTGRDTDPSRFVDARAYEYEWTCAGEVDARHSPLSSEPPVEDCSEGIWPDLDPTAVCPTTSEATRLDPESGLTLPLSDGRSLPTTIPVSESGSFLPGDLPSSWPATLRVVAWNMEYTANIDAQLDTLVNHPELRNADVYLLSEVDRCSSRNGVRRAARELARRVEGEYVYGIEFVELNIGREVGGDTGQAIVSRRPMTSAALLCHSSQFDWFASEGEPRLGQRVALHADIPVGDAFARVWAMHLESNDVWGERRAIQSKEVLDVSQLVACDRPQVVAGDFNAWFANAPELRVFVDNGFVDALAELGDTEATHEGGLRLDYVFARGLQVRGGGVLREVRTSDHAPLWVDFRLE